ncbi:hypothetical protein LguiA_008185 [Lonicera macranthoides]
MIKLRCPIKTMTQFQEMPIWQRERHCAGAERAASIHSSTGFENKSYAAAITCFGSMKTSRGLENGVIGQRILQYSFCLGWRDVEIPIKESVVDSEWSFSNDAMEIRDSKPKVVGSQVQVSGLNCFAALSNLDDNDGKEKEKMDGVILELNPQTNELSVTSLRIDE